MFCNKCGQQIPDDSKFCYKCGNVISTFNNMNTNGSGNDEKLKGDSEKTSSAKKWIIGILILMCLPILSWTFFFNTLALTIVVFSWKFAKEAFQGKQLVKMVAIIVVGFISFAVVAGLKGAMQIERKNKLYNNQKYSDKIDNNVMKNDFIKIGV